MARPDFEAITRDQRETWALGDFNVIAMAHIGVAEELVGEVDVRPGQRVLDVACGSGNAALVAARRHCDVVGIDFVPALIERARLRGAADGVVADFRVADAQALPFDGGRFDHVLSVFGVMFAPDQARAAAELLRVTRPGGTIALASWTPGQLGGDFYDTVAAYAPALVPELEPASRWGTVDGLAALLGDGVTAIDTQRRTNVSYFRSIDHAIDLHVRWFGPLVRLYEGLDDAGKATLRAELAAVFGKYNRATDGTAALEGVYLRMIARRR
jgi:SAM-dependent methyltransferase